MSIEAPHKVFHEIRVGRNPRRLEGRRMIIKGWFSSLSFENIFPQNFSKIYKRVRSLNFGGLIKNSPWCYSNFGKWFGFGRLLTLEIPREPCFLISMCLDFGILIYKTFPPTLCFSYAIVHAYKIHDLFTSIASTKLSRENIFSFFCIVVWPWNAFTILSIIKHPWIQVLTNIIWFFFFWPEVLSFFVGNDWIWYRLNEL